MALFGRLFGKKTRRRTSSDPKRESKRGRWIGSFGVFWSGIRQQWTVLFSPKHHVETASVIGWYDTKKEAERVAEGRTGSDPARRKLSNPRIRKKLHLGSKGVSSRNASGDYAARYRGPKHVYASPEVKRTASYKRAERLERELAPRAWETPGLSRKDLERVADAWERAGFLGWADNYRAHARRAGRDPARRHRRPGTPTFAQQKRISRKIRTLRHEGYGPAQAAAIAYRMEGVPYRPARARAR
jgi:hypothetical protein